MIQIVVLKWFIQTGLSKNGTWVLKINIIKHSTWQNDLSRTYTWSVNKVIRNRRPSVYDELLLDEETCCYLWQMLARRPCSAVVWQLEHVSNFPDSGVYVHVYAEFLTWYILMIWIPNHPYSACPCWLDYFGSSKISCAIISNHGSGAPVWATVNGQLLFSKNDKPSFVIEREWANWRRLVLELLLLRQLQRLWAQLGHWLNRLPVPNKTRPGLKKIHEEWLRTAQWQVRQHCWRLMGRSKDWDSENRSWLVGEPQPAAEHCNGGSTGLSRLRKSSPMHWSQGSRCTWQTAAGLGKLDRFDGDLEKFLPWRSKATSYSCSIRKEMAGKERISDVAATYGPSADPIGQIANNEKLRRDLFDVLCNSWTWSWWCSTSHKSWFEANACHTPGRWEAGRSLWTILEIDVWNKRRGQYLAEGLHRINAEAIFARNTAWPSVFYHREMGRRFLYGVVLADDAGQAFPKETLQKNHERVSTEVLDMVNTKH